MSPCHLALELDRTGKQKEQISFSRSRQEKEKGWKESSTGISTLSHAICPSRASNHLRLVNWVHLTHQPSGFHNFLSDHTIAPGLSQILSSFQNSDCQLQLYIMRIIWGALERPSYNLDQQGSVGPQGGTPGNDKVSDSQCADQA